MQKLHMSQSEQNLHLATSLEVKAWLASNGRRGGLSRSEVKAAASRLNGMKGGRPKGSTKKAEVTHEL